MCFVGFELRRVNQRVSPQDVVQAVLTVLPAHSFFTSETELVESSLVEGLAAGPADCGERWARVSSCSLSF